MEAVENGFKGTREEFIKSLPEDELRRFLVQVESNRFYFENKRKPEKSIRKLDLASQFAPDTTRLN